MTFHVRTEVFEGPLDLLLQLITKHQLEISAIGLTEVVAEYLSFVDEMASLDLEVTSEFLMLAATLVQMKAHSLLPTGSELDVDDELAFIEERDRLISRLLASVTFKDVSAVLLRRIQEGNRFVARVSGIDQRITAGDNLVDLPFDPAGLADLAVRVFSRRDLEPDLDHLELDLPSVEAAIVDIRARVTADVMSSFDQLTSDCKRPVEVAAYFLAVLELARWGLLEVSQRDWSSDIQVLHRAGGELDLTSEWAG